MFISDSHNHHTSTTTTTNLKGVIAMNTLNTLNNQSIRTYAKKQGVRLYEVAKHLNISTSTLTRRLYYELSAEETNNMLMCIDTIADSRTEAGRTSHKVRE